MRLTALVTYCARRVAVYVICWVGGAFCQLRFS
jgi:hypothetical protein